MTKDRISEIETRAREILESHQIVEPFVNVFDIANEAGLSIEYRKMPQGNQDVSGFLDVSSNTIYINVDNSITRRAYTVAHELGHYFLNHKPDEYGVYRRSNSYTGDKHQKEKEADCFAANLLMPRHMLESKIKSYPFLASSPQLLSDLFGVSPSAMTYRLMNLGLLAR